MDNLQINKAHIRIQKRIRRVKFKEAVELYTEIVLLLLVIMLLVICVYYFFLFETSPPRPLSFVRRGGVFLLESKVTFISCSSRKAGGLGRGGIPP